jgi:NAD(P)H-dependent FMN reductase
MANVTLVGISGSLRKASFNTALLRAASELMPEGATLAVHSIRDIPLYDGDVEAAEGLPAAVQSLKDAIAGSQGLVIASPEYNASIPGVLKNAIDWLSRPPADIKRVFADKPVALVGATPGPGGTRLAQTAWLPVFRLLGMRPWWGKSLYVGGASKVFDAEGKLTDEATRKQLKDLVEGFVEFAAKG